MGMEEQLRKQIEIYMDQLLTLRAQPLIDEEEVAQILSEVATPIMEYQELINQNVGEKIRAVELREASTLEEVLQKRLDSIAILEEAVGKINSLSEKNGNYAPEIKRKLDLIVSPMNQDLDTVKSNADIVRRQIERTKAVKPQHEELLAKKNGILLDMGVLRGNQIGFEELEQIVQEVYDEFLEKNQAEPINPQEVIARKKALQAKLQNLEVEFNKFATESWKTVVGRDIQAVKKELNDLEEKAFVHLAGKVMKEKVNNIDELQKRSSVIETLIRARKISVAKFKNEKAIDENYQTAATTIDVSAQTYIETEHKIASLNREANAIDAQIGILYSGIIGPQTLENQFNQNAISSHYLPTTLQSATQPPVTVETEELKDFEVITPEEMEEERKRRKVVSVQELPPKKKKGILRKWISKLFVLGITAKVFLSFSDSIDKLNMHQFEDIVHQNYETTISQLEKTEKANLISNNVDAQDIISEQDIETLNVEEETYEPSIGDKIRLQEGSKIYATSQNAAQTQSGYEAKESGLENAELYATRGVILNSNNQPVFSTTEYGVNLDEVAQNMNLTDYSVVLGCSIGDDKGNFIPVSQDKLNPNIEKGWINVKDSNLIIVEQLSQTLAKGGLQR